LHLGTGSDDIPRNTLPAQMEHRSDNRQICPLILTMIHPMKMERKMHKLLAKIAVSAFVTLPLIAAASPEFPVRPVKLIIPFAAGGPADLVARQVVEKWSEKLGQPVIIENQGGGMGVPALNAVIRSAPDGHTVLFAASGNIIAQPILNNTESDIAKLAP